MLSLGVVVALVFIGVLLLALFFHFIPLTLWIRAVASGVYVSFLTLFGMRFRKVNPAAIVDPLITARKAGLDLTINDLEIHYLSGGNVQRVVNALISADKAGIPLTYKLATAIDLAGRDVFEAVQVSVNPKVITTPKVAAMAKDGIQLLALARVTVRANVNRLVGGAWTRRGRSNFLALIRKVIANIREYQEHIRVRDPAPLVRNGRRLGVRYTPIERVGVYVPGGRALYPSTVLMTVVPAQVAGVREIVMASPPHGRSHQRPGTGAGGRARDPRSAAARWRSGRRCDGLRNRVDSPGAQDRRPRQCVRGRSQATAVRSCRHRLGRGPERSGDRRR